LINQNPDWWLSGAEATAKFRPQAVGGKFVWVLQGLDGFYFYWMVLLINQNPDWWLSGAEATAFFACSKKVNKERAPAS
jgi:hypothetical protein